MKKFALLIGSLLLTGCATIFSGTSQTINVRVVDASTQQLVSNVSCAVSDGNGSTYSITTNPSAISVTKGNGAIRIDCRIPGYKQSNMSVGDSFNALTVINVLFWPGFIVDVASGAYKKYPSHYQVNMERTA